jgi:hypothetical protein
VVDLTRAHASRQALLVDLGSLADAGRPLAATAVPVDLLQCVAGVLVQRAARLTARFRFPAQARRCRPQYGQLLARAAGASACRQRVAQRRHHAVPGTHAPPAVCSALLLTLIRARSGSTACSRSSWPTPSPTRRRALSCCARRQSPLRCAYPERWRPLLFLVPTHNSDVYTSPSLISTRELGHRLSAAAPKPGPFCDSRNTHCVSDAPSFAARRSAVGEFRRCRGRPASASSSRLLARRRAHPHRRTG